MFHIYFCEGRKLPEAIVFRREGHLDVKWGHLGVMTEEFLRVRPSDEQSFVDFRARWKGDSLLEERVVHNFLATLRHPNPDRVFIPSGILSVSGIREEDWKAFRNRIETDIWFFADADGRPATTEVHSEILHWLRGDSDLAMPRNRTIEAFADFVKSFGGPQPEAERELVDKFTRRLKALKALPPLGRLRSYISMDFDPVRPEMRLESELAETMQKELVTNPDALRALLEIPRSRIPIWGYPAGSLLSPCIVELAYCIEHNIKYRKCQSPGCATWFALVDSGYAKDCHRCRSLNPTLRSRARKRAQNPEEFKLQWAWRRSNERRARGRSQISLAEYRKTYKPRSAN